jgi:solute carrier family 25 S-adenosylmethionine transporter 26
MSTVDAFRLAVGADDGGGRGDNSTMMDGVAELYSGYGENVLYAFPADIIKFAAYEYLTGLGGKGTKKNSVSPVDGAFYGALSTAISQFATTPLDVLRNRIMAEVASVVDDEDGPSAIARPSYVDRMTGIAKEEGVGALFAGSWPRVAKAILSGAIQFATYEETKQKMSQLFIRR